MVDLFASLFVLKRRTGLRPSFPPRQSAWPSALPRIPFLGLLIMLLFNSSAIACPVITEAYPKVGSEGPAPKYVSLEFTGKIYPEKSMVAVTDASGATVSTGAPYGKAEDDKFIATKVADLKPGKYKVKWNVLCDCGTMNPGDYKFTVE